MSGDKDSHRFITSHRSSSNIYTPPPTPLTRMKTTLSAAALTPPRRPGFMDRFPLLRIQQQLLVTLVTIPLPI